MLEFKGCFMVPVMRDQMDALKLRILREEQDGVEGCDRGRCLIPLDI